MTLNLLTNPRRFVLVLATAAILALTATSASLWLDEVAGTSLTPAAFACDAQGGMCG